MLDVIAYIILGIIFLFVGVFLLAGVLILASVVLFVVVGPVIAVIQAATKHL